MKYLPLIAGFLLTISITHAQQKAPAANAEKVAMPEANLAGKVLESMNAANYTYVLVDTGKRKVWAAGVQFDVKKGDTVSISDAMPMQNYHSKTLNRDFELVYFASGITVDGKASQAELPAGHPPISGANAKSKLDFDGIKKAVGGKRIEEIYAGKAALHNQRVLVRGQVVKYNAMILGKNWLHLQDGTGSPGTNDLVVTTDSRVSVGDTVLVSGKLSTNRDFGSGYKYDLIIEDAKVTVE
jgi:hypothetical protein